MVGAPDSVVEPSSCGAWPKKNLGSDREHHAEDECESLGIKKELWLVPGFVCGDMLLPMNGTLKEQGHEKSPY